MKNFPTVEGLMARLLALRSAESFTHLFFGPDDFEDPEKFLDTHQPLRVGITKHAYIDKQANDARYYRIVLEEGDEEGWETYLQRLKPGSEVVYDQEHALVEDAPIVLAFFLLEAKRAWEIVAGAHQVVEELR